MHLFKRERQITVQNTPVSIHDVGGKDYICLTDMAKGEESADHVKNWMRTRTTVEFLGLWETMHNPRFKGIEFDRFRAEAGLNNFTLSPQKWFETLSPQKWVEATEAVGIISRNIRD
jgi:hypothetical protein